MVFLGEMGPQEGTGNKDPLVPLELLDPLVPRVEGLCISGGGKVLVLK